MKFPPEIFRIVAELSSPRTRRILLFVSTMMHDLTLPFIFTRIVLTFGIKLSRVWYAREEGSLFTERERSHFESRNSRARDFLRFIADNAVVAASVRTVSVRWLQFPEAPDAGALELGEWQLPFSIMPATM